MRVRIFYYDPDGFIVLGHPSYGGDYTAHYLEAAPTNASVSIIRWCNCDSGAGCRPSSGVDQIGSGFISTSLISTGTDTPNMDNINADIGKGRRNTALTVAYHTSDTSSNNAAKACDVYISNGYSDWFLPSIGELYWLYQNKSDAGMGSVTNYFWSSSQDSSDLAWYIYFNYGGRNGYAKYYSSHVRAVRAF